MQTIAKGCSAVVLAAALSWFASDAAAEPSRVRAASAAAGPCLPRAALAGLLAERYGERPLLMGLADGGGAMELFARPDGASWTIAMTLPNGLACLIAAGEALQPGVAAPSEPEGREG